jgi:hypothetical protein
MPKPAKPTLDPWTFDALREQAPRTAELFKASRYYSYHDSFDITKALYEYLDSRDFTIYVHSVAKSDRANAAIAGYEATIHIKHQPVPIERRIFPHFDDARIHALGYVVDIFEEEQKITA